MLGLDVKLSLDGAVDVGVPPRGGVRELERERVGDGDGAPAEVRRDAPLLQLGAEMDCANLDEVRAGQELAPGEVAGDKEGEVGRARSTSATVGGSRAAWRVATRLVHPPSSARLVARSYRAKALPSPFSAASSAWTWRPGR